jgi:hypothetical protein
MCDNWGREISTPLALGSSVGLEIFDYFKPVLGRLLAGLICVNM